jgi:hypothetical protein
MDIFIEDFEFKENILLSGSCGIYNTKLKGY